MLFLSACVTINIYFPSAEAKEAAEAIVEDIMQTAPPGTEIKVHDGDGKSSGVMRGGWSDWSFSLLDLLVPAAHAAQPDFSVDTPEIRRIQASLKQRHAALRPYFQSGAVGLTQDGRLSVRDAGAVALRERGRLNTLVGDDNSERDALYRAIAKANGHPEWEADVRAVFAQTWIDKAEGGWWYRDGNGKWVRK